MVSRVVPLNTTSTSPQPYSQEQRTGKTSPDPSSVTEPPTIRVPQGITLLIPRAPDNPNRDLFNTSDSQNHSPNITAPPSPPQTFDIILLSHNTDSFNMEDYITATDDRSEILAWLSPLEPHLRHHDIQTRRVKNVGDWLLRTEEFRGWMNCDGQGESQKATIFCSGNLGVGKTYIR